MKKGRGHQCDLRISDISVSRFHSFIKYDKGLFSIFDNNSKFGTLILIQKPVQIKAEKLAIQVGRTVISLCKKNLQIPPPIMNGQKKPVKTEDKMEIENEENGMNGKSEPTQLDEKDKDKETKTDNFLDDIFK